MVSSNNRQGAALRRVLERALANRATVLADTSAGDGLVRVVVETSGSSVSLIPVAAGTGYPQDVRRALPSLAEVSPGDAPVLVATRFSPGARELMDAHQTSWADAAGNARITVPPLVVVVDAATTPSAPVRDARWTDGSGAVAEVVLGDVVDRGSSAPVATGSSIAQRLGISAPVVSRALQGFDDAGWTVKSGAERGPGAVRRVADAGALLSSWAAWHTARPGSMTLAHTLIPDVDAWLGTLRDRWPAGRWAVTGEAAAARRAPLLSRVTVVDLYVDPDPYDDDLDHMLDTAGLRPVEAGGRVRVLKADPYLLRRVTPPAPGGVPLVPDVRLYGDLLRTGVRGEEAATELRDRRLGF